MEHEIFLIVPLVIIKPGFIADFIGPEFKCPVVGIAVPDVNASLVIESVIQVEHPWKGEIMELIRIIHP
jgi:hypothetical protein